MYISIKLSYFTDLIDIVLRLPKLTFLTVCWKRVRVQNSGWAWRGAQGGRLRCWSCSLSWTQYCLYHSVHCLRNHLFIYLRFVYSSVFMPYFKYKIYLNYLYRSHISLQLLMLEETTVERGKWTYTFFTREKKILLWQCPLTDKRRWR